MATFRVKLEVVLDLECAGDEVPLISSVINELDYNFVSNTPEVQIKHTEIRDSNFSESFSL